MTATVNKNLNGYIKITDNLSVIAQLTANITVTIMRKSIITLTETVVYGLTVRKKYELI